jgi:type I restriction enzyme, S subunit
LTKEWARTTLGNAATLQRGYDLPQRDRRLGPIPVVTSSGITDTHAESRVVGPGVVTGRYGTIGKVFFVEQDFWPLNTTLFVKDFHGNDPRFIFYLLQTIDFHSCSGKSGVPGVDRNDLHKLEVVCPSLPEQRAIAAALSDADALIASLEKLIAKKRDLKQATMQELLTGRTRLPGFRGNWEPLNMADKSQLKARIGWQGLTTAEYLDTGDYYLVTGTDFADGHIIWGTCHFVDQSRYAQDKLIQLRQGDILLTKDGTIGKVAYVDSLPGPATLNSGVFVIRPRDSAYAPQFLYRILSSRVFDDFLIRLQAGSTITHLYQKDFVNFSFLAPETPEQVAIAEVLSDTDAEIAALEKRLSKTRDLKRGMMQELLTGRTRLV